MIPISLQKKEPKSVTTITNDKNRTQGCGSMLSGPVICLRFFFHCFVCSECDIELIKSMEDDSIHFIQFLHTCDLRLPYALFFAWCSFGKQFSCKSSLPEHCHPYHQEDAIQKRMNLYFSMIKQGFRCCVGSD